MSLGWSEIGPDNDSNILPSEVPPKSIGASGDPYTSIALKTSVLVPTVMFACCMLQESV